MTTKLSSPFQPIGAAVVVLMIVKTKQNHMVLELSI